MSSRTRPSCHCEESCALTINGIPHAIATTGRRDLLDGHSIAAFNRDPERVEPLVKQPHVDQHNERPQRYNCFGASKRYQNVFESEGSRP